MSGAEGLVIVGAIASVWTLIEACNKTKCLYTRLKDDRRGAYLSSLTPRLELVKDTLELLRSHTLESSQTHNLRNHLSTFESLMGRFNQHILMLESASSNSALQNLSHRRKASTALQALKELDTELMQWQVAISTHIVTRLLPHPQTDAIMEVATLPTMETLTYQKSGKKGLQKSPCQKGTCSCLCHLSWRKQRALIISAPANLVMRCGCHRKDINISISALQRIWTFQVAIDWTQGMKLSSSIQYRNTVKRTSPGFLILEKCYHDQMSFESARAALTTLANERVISFTDVTPDGDGMLERVIQRPWIGPFYDLQWDLIAFLVQAGAPVDTERLLEISFRWVGEGPFLDLVETLASQSRQSLDATDITPNLFSYWPRAASSDWQIPFRSGDTFYVRTLSILIESDPEFGGSTALHGAVLRSEMNRVEGLNRRPSVSRNDRNFMGQSVLHLAVLDPNMVAFLLSKIPDLELDAQDNGGTTPLMYAMVYRQADSAALLLLAGADPFCRDRLNHLCAWDYALACTGHRLLQFCMDAWSETRPDQAAKAIEYCLWHRALVKIPRHYEQEDATLRFLLDAKVAHNTVTPCHNTLLHVCDPSEVEIMLDYETIPINHKNCLGYTPLMVLLRSSRDNLLELIKRAISRGASVDLVDSNDRNVLHHLSLRISTSNQCGPVSSSTWLSVMKSAAALLCANVSLNGGDRCRCPCSSHGCNPLVYFFPTNCSSWIIAMEENDLNAIPWLLEWLIIIRHFRPAAEVYAALMALYRRCRFDEIGMTHTCCRRRQREWDFDFGRLSPLEDEFEHRREGRHKHFDREEVVHTMSEQDFDAEEIRDEEKYYESQLEYDCEEFRAVADANLEAAWLKLLSRRTVRMEEILSMARNKRGSALVRCRPPQPDRTKIRGEIITEKPLRYVDHEKDIIEQVPDSHDWDEWAKHDSNLRLDDCVEKYLAAFNDDPKYMEGVPATHIELADWRDQRSKLATRLLEEAAELRASPKEDREWDL